ncbi:hypothetical protein CR513_26377, partial [Mucuna pruriens]
MVETKSSSLRHFIKDSETGPFSDSLALSQSASMTEIRVRTEKHVEAEEDKKDCLQAERAIPTIKKKNVHGFQTNHQSLSSPIIRHSTPMQHQLGPSHDEWCEFHKICDHLTEECRMLKSQIEKLIQDGYLGRFVRRMEDEKQTTNDHSRRNRSQTPGSMAKMSLAAQERPTKRQDPQITFSNEDYEVIADYKVERVSVYQGSSTNVLFWPAFRKMGLSKSNLEACQGTLIEFVGEQVKI